MPTILETDTWYVNLNNFLLNQCTTIETIEDATRQFTVKEKHAIISDAMQILLEKMGINEDEWEDHENDIDWDRFDDIINNYIYQYKPKNYGVDGKELKNEICYAAGSDE